MSGFRVHMLVDAVGGLALITALDHYAPKILAGVLPGQPVAISQAGSSLGVLW